VSDVAERYARAIFELAVEANELGTITGQFRAIAEAFKTSPELQSIAENPVVDEASRDGLLKELGARLGLSALAVNSLRLVGARKRLRALPDIAAELQRLADDNAGVLRATVTSAKPLTEEYYARLGAELQKTTGRRILFERREDASLIGGVVTRIGDHTIDGSVRGRLQALERQLLSSN
jgi:F-type H+-transporting ATPase subunit delta